jgi:hypothetical protein
VRRWLSHQVLIASKIQEWWASCTWVGITLTCSILVRLSKPSLEQAKVSSTCTVVRSGCWMLWDMRAHNGTTGAAVSFVVETGPLNLPWPSAFYCWLLCQFTCYAKPNRRINVSPHVNIVGWCFRNTASSCLEQLVNGWLSVNCWVAAQWSLLKRISDKSWRHSCWNNYVVSSDWQI